MARTARREQGSALLITMLVLVLLGLVGSAALQTVTRDQQTAGFLNRKRVALYAAEAGVAESLERLTNNGTPAVNTVTLSDSTLFPYGQPSYRPDPSATDPIDLVGSGPFPGTELNIEQNGVPMFQIQYWRVRVEGQAPGGSRARLETVVGALAGN